jgi:hypothetical protein
MFSHSYLASLFSVVSASSSAKVAPTEQAKPIPKPAIGITEGNVTTAASAIDPAMKSKNPRAIPIVKAFANFLAKDGISFYLRKNELSIL